MGLGCFLGFCWVVWVFGFLWVSLVSLYTFCVQALALFDIFNNYLYKKKKKTITHWNPSFIRAVQDWKLESLVAFVDRLYCLITSLIKTDKMLWSLARNHRFEVKSFYYSLQSAESSPFPWKNTWKVKPSPCIAFFTWTAALSKILTIDNLSRRGITLIN